MAGKFLNKLLGSMNLDSYDDSDQGYYDDDDASYGDNYEDESAEYDDSRDERPAPRKNSFFRKHRHSQLEEQSENDDYYDDEEEERSFSPSRKSSGKVVQLQTRPGSSQEVKSVKPETSEESHQICDYLISGKCVIMNLEGMTDTESQRLVDIISGCLYALNGSISKISGYVFMCAPNNIQVTGDFASTNTVDSSFPTVNGDFR
jgi:cell division inhibitor SepF